MSSWYELAIIAFIVCTIIFISWRGGAANPVGTAVLEKNVTKLRTDVDGIGDRLDRIDRSMATGDDLEQARDKIDRAFASLDRVDEELAALGNLVGSRNVVIEALAESVRAMSAELKEHRQDVERRLRSLSGLSERIDANRRAIESISSALPAITQRQASMAEQVATTAADTRHTKQVVDEMMRHIVSKGMNS